MLCFSVNCLTSSPAPMMWNIVRSIPGNVVLLGELFDIFSCADEVLQVERNSALVENARIALLRCPFPEFAVAVLLEIVKPVFLPAVGFEPPIADLLPGVLSRRIETNVNFKVGGGIKSGVQVRQ